MSKIDTNYHMILKLKDFKPEKKGFLNEKEVKTIEETLHVKEMDILQLRNLRDFTVLFFEKDVSEENTMEKIDIISAITSVIDRRLFHLGAKV